MKKTSFRISNNKEVSDKFQKHVFRFTDGYNGKTVLVYMGDSEAYQNLPHGNRKRNNRPHKRSKPSLINTIKSQTNVAPKAVFESMKSEQFQEILDK